MTAQLLAAPSRGGLARCIRVLGAVLGLVAVVAAAQGTAPVPAPPPLRVLDRFDDVAAWKSVASDGVTASVGAIVDGKRQALRLTFDLGGTAGYAVARRALPIVLPENYAITFWLRADAPVNDLQVKLADASGDNVWWYNRPSFAFPREWQQVTIKKRQIEFAWGPTKDRALREFATIEIAVAAGSGGGRGSLYVSELSLQSCPRCPKHGRRRRRARRRRSVDRILRMSSMVPSRLRGAAIRRRPASSG